MTVCTIFDTNLHHYSMFLGAQRFSIKKWQQDQCSTRCFIDESLYSGPYLEKFVCLFVCLDAARNYCSVNHNWQYRRIRTEEVTVWGSVWEVCVGKREKITFVEHALKVLHSSFTTLDERKLTFKMSGICCAESNYSYSYQSAVWTGFL